MVLRIAINGLGRIGRCAVRAICERALDEIKLVAVNGSMPAEGYTTLLKYDSVHGKFSQEVRAVDDRLFVGTNEIKVFNERSPENLPWEAEKIDLVLECTGKFKTKETASKHLQAGAKKVIISAPGKGVDTTIVFGVNDHMLRDEHKIISIGSCTTNALAPLAKILHESIGIEHGYMTTIHAYTNDQNVLDNSHTDLRRARACHMSMIPTETGAAKAIGLILPELDGKISGSAIRVPVPNVSFIDFVFSAARETSKEEVNDIIHQVSLSSMKNIIDVAERELVSVDFNHSTHSTIFDPFETKVVNKKLVRVASWYDNEWGFTNRMIDVGMLIKAFAKISV
jgi:glyceraldehyde 3-phosphate dehydrogenase